MHASCIECLQGSPTKDSSAKRQKCMQSNDQESDIQSDSAAIASTAAESNVNQDLHASAHAPSKKALIKKSGVVHHSMDCMAKGSTLNEHEECKCKYEDENFSYDLRDHWIYFQ